VAWAWHDIALQEESRLVKHAQILFNILPGFHSTSFSLYRLHVVHQPVKTVDLELLQLSL
jgi:hypothetical protein